MLAIFSKRGFFSLYLVFQLQNEGDMTYNINLCPSEDTPLEYNVFWNLNMGTGRQRLCIFVFSLSSNIQICSQEFCGSVWIFIHPGSLDIEGIEGDVLCPKPAWVESESPPCALLRAGRGHFHSFFQRRSLVLLRHPCRCCCVPSSCPRWNHKNTHENSLEVNDTEIFSH